MNKLKFGIIIFALCVCAIFLPKNRVMADAASSSVFNFTFQGQSFPVSQDQLNSWQGQEIITPSLVFSPYPEPLTSSLITALGQTPPNTAAFKTYDYELAPIYNFISGLAEKIDQPVVEPVLTIQNNRAVNFAPPQNGEEVDAYQTAVAALNALQAGQTSLEITTYQTIPDQGLSQTNSLGINELLAHGVSGFKGSPNNRRHNIAAGIEKFKGLIIPQGATFSFDDNLGPVTAEAGFLPELVIDNGTTLPELGGGLCQVSTTAFRAAMAAGLPITDRRNHAYAVSYYSPQGTDATIYPGSADLKFINNTPGDILIWPYEQDPNTLVFDFYGTNDGRQVTLEKPVVYDRQPDESMKATWTRLVTSADGSQRTDVFKSNYQSPALFHKTEKFVPAAPPTSSGVTMPEKIQ